MSVLRRSFNVYWKKMQDKMPLYIIFYIEQETVDERLQKRSINQEANDSQSNVIENDSKEELQNVLKENAR